MASPVNYLPIRGELVKSEHKSHFSSLKTSRAVGLAFGFILVFITFTIFLAFNPSTSPWLTNAFSRRIDAIPDSDKYRTKISSIVSFFFPEIVTDKGVHKSSPTIRRINSNRVDDNNTQIHNMYKKQPREENAFNSDLAPNSQEFLRPNETTFTQVPSRSEAYMPNGPMSAQAPCRLDALIPDRNASVQAPNGSKISDSNTIKQQVKDRTQIGRNSDETKALKANESVPVPKKLVVVSQSLPSVSDSPRKVNAGKGENSGARGNVVSDAPLHKGSDDLLESLVKCDLFDGEWVKDDSYPLYQPGSCPLIDEQFDCYTNGRHDKDYQKLRWKPKGCNLPRLNASHMLDLLRGKRLVFVGDSLNRNMWESLVCILRSSLKDQTKVFEAQGRQQFRGETSYSFIFKDYNCTVEFFVSPFLVQEWEMPNKKGSKKETLRLDLIERSCDQFKGADILIFNTGHWWTHEKTYRGKDYYQEGSHVYEELNVLDAFRKALTTWSQWVSANAHPTKSLVLFRGYSASHFGGGEWNSGGSCNSLKPFKNETSLSLEEYLPMMTVVESVLEEMKTQVTYLNITQLTNYRKDAHPSIYWKQNMSEMEMRSPQTYQDCSHWCLPGVPDAWNELLYAELLVKQYHTKKQ